MLRGPGQDLRVCGIQRAKLRPVLRVMARSPNRLLKNGVSPLGRGGYAQDKDAKSANSSAIGATEDEVLRRPARSGGRDAVFQQPAKSIRPGWCEAGVDNELHEAARSTSRSSARHAA
jgi:hypothetical protein